MTTRRSSEVRPIDAVDVDAAADFLHTHMNEAVPSEAWAGAMRSAWQHNPPNHGTMLVVDGSVVGVHLAYYSERNIRGRSLAICNLGAWCVLEEHRFRGMRLLQALLAQAGYHFVDLSPSGNVVALNERLGFRHLDTTTFITPNLPWPIWPGRVRLTDDLEVIERTLEGDQLRIFCDHRDAAAVHHVLVTRGSEHCHVMFRLDRRRNLPLFATILHVSDRRLFGELHRHVGRHMLLRCRRPAMLGEIRTTGSRPRLSRTLRSSRPKMFRSDTLDAGDIDDLYSELEALAW